MVSDEDREWFVEAFYDAVESWFTADIACCDSCHDEFVALWPHAYSANDGEFQRSCIDLNLFYEGSRLKELYSKGDYDEYIKDMTCPRCGNKLGPYMWPYELPFDVDPDFENTITDIAILADQTPFLILSHDFAQEVYNTLRRIGSSLDTTVLRGSLWRARLKSTRNPTIPEELTEFDRPPRNYASEGRYNHAGNPVLYLASDLNTCFEEMQQSPCVVAELSFDTSLKILDLVNPIESHPESADELQSLVYSALLSAKQSSAGLHKPHYIFSRFITDCARASGIQAIKYFSTRIVESNYNLVIVDPEVRLEDVATLKRCVHMPIGDLT